MPICTYSTLDSTHYSSTYGTYISTQVFGTIHRFYSFAGNKHLLRVHFMLGKVFYVNITEITQTGMQCDISKINAFNFHSFHQFTAKVQTGSRRRYSSFVLCKDRLETYRIFFFYRTINDRVGQWSFTQRIECFLKFVMGTIIEETQCTPT